MNRRWALVAPLLVLAACQDEAPVDETRAGAGAEGQVLGGTISDDMIPLDTLRSQSPPLRTGAGSASADDPGNEAATAAPAEADAAEESAEAGEETAAQPDPEAE